MVHFVLTMLLIQFGLNMVIGVRSLAKGEVAVGITVLILAGLSIWGVIYLAVN